MSALCIAAVCIYAIMVSATFLPPVEYAHIWATCVVFRWLFFGVLDYSIPPIYFRGTVYLRNYGKAVLRPSVKYAQI